MTDDERDFLRVVAAGVMLTLQGLANGESNAWFLEQGQEIDDALCRLGEKLDLEGLNSDE